MIYPPLLLYTTCAFYLTLLATNVPGSDAWNAKWQLQRRADPWKPIHLYIGLAMDKAHARLEQAAAEIANPTHVRHRHHLRSWDLKQALEPDQHSVKQVLQWLDSVGVTDARSRGGIVEASMEIWQVETLLNTTYNVYSDGPHTVMRTEAYHLPEHSRHHVSFVSPTTMFPTRSKPLHVQEVLHAGVYDVDKRAMCGSKDYTTPSCIRQAYAINYTAKPNRTTFAIYATEAASYRSADMHTFLRKYNPAAAAANARFGIVGNGDPADGKPGIGGAFETHLDTQTSLGLAWPAQGILYDLGGVFGPKAGETYDPFVHFLQDLIHNETVPSVVSFSESMPEDQVDPAYARSLCSMMAAVGARGTTLLFSSGDNGPQGDQPTGKHNAVFEPEFPCSCPWVTCVGGTTDMAAETAATPSTISGLINKFTYTASGGGFSNRFPRPAYQDHVVSDYNADHIPGSYYTKSGFNASGRGSPDIAAFSTRFPVIWNGLTVAVGGTSASTPLWAAVIALLNDFEAEKGRPSLGFINPWLYSLAEGALKDITTGGHNNGSCYWVSGCSLPETPGYEVTKGWDPVTGLGSPLFSGLMQALDKQAAATRRSDVDQIV